ncbi:MAG: hypothetical protein ACR2MX_01570 [Cyclobacteriaceae bacterium]
MESNKKILIGSIGYHNLSNHSVGPLLMPVLKEMEWPNGVDLEEMNWGPIAIVQQFETMAEPYDRVVILTAMHQESRQVGTITIHKWAGGLPDEENIQARIGDAVTGVISVENLLIIGEYFKIWPKEVYIIDVEPGPEKAGPELDEIVQDKANEIIAVVKQAGIEGSYQNQELSFIFGHSPIEN